MEFLKNDKHPCHHKNFGLLVKILIIFLAVLTLSFAVGAWNKIKESKYIGQDIIVRNTISVSGTGEAYVKPNLGLVSFSVITEKKTVAQSMSENTKKMNKVIETMKALGIEEKDLKTTQFDIYPRYEYQDDETFPLREKRVLVGYEVFQSLQVKIRDLEKSGQIVQGAADAGANQVGDLTFAVDDQKRGEAEKQTRKDAIKEAKEQAKEIAKQLGVGLIRIIDFSEQSYAPRSDYMLKEAYGSGGATPQIETGENKIETTVYITYEIN